MPIRIDRSEAVITLVLDRPEARNALSIEMCDAIVDGLSDIETDREARVVIVRGEGKAFCAGADLAAVSGPHASDFLIAFEKMLEAVARFRLPTIAAIHGAALGGGFQLATVCDFRVASAEATIGIPSSTLGIVVNLENVQRLVALCGAATAKEVLMAACRFTGAEAAQRGLVTKAVAPADLEAAVDELATSIAALAPLSVQGSKRAIQTIVDHMTDARSHRPDESSAIDELVMGAYNSTDLIEGLKAASEKRSARFKGE
ncbi:MAG: enoyl-CoA hydratase/isomerase family protein [Actinomycetota bacterium]